MKIAIISPPWIAIPPLGYGGIELVVYNLTEELIKKGHDVLLHATGDSITSAKLSYFYKKALGNKLELKNQSLIIIPHLYDFFKKIKKEKIDIIHNNCQYEAMYFCDLQDIPFVHTLHGAFYKKLKSPSGVNFLKRKTLLRFKNHPFISISNNQRNGIPELNYIKTIYNSININQFTKGEGKGNYLVYLGRITPNKGVDTAIKVAKKLKMKLKIAFYVDPGDENYFKKEILPLVNKNIEFINEIKNIEEKNKLLGNAFAFLFPIRWHEPFGIVMIEAMATGTPVIAFNKGSVPEVILDKKTGFIVKDEKEMIQAVKNAGSLDRNYISQYAKNNFSTDKMANDYIKTYLEVIKSWNK